ncbi:hypothetical protein Bealeia1_00494 [Candidatus Bealeia paramacronuclearis]|uniref:Uncharacterized protein n=1 Tax=Candidatus Bealeia paramacronuclearis TaxID=1921001 RepID=A0ABZ2C2L8_9PROT|nr:hypothetical protein [Candidatus Bealeia paramacronuclearis]
MLFAKSKLLLTATFFSFALTSPVWAIGEDKDSRIGVKPVPVLKEIPVDELKVMNSKISTSINYSYNSEDSPQRIMDKLAAYFSSENPNLFKREKLTFVNGYLCGRPHNSNTAMEFLAFLEFLKHVPGNIDTLNEILPQRATPYSYFQLNEGIQSKLYDLASSQEIEKKWSLKDSFYNAVSSFIRNDPRDDMAVALAIGLYTNALTRERVYYPVISSIESVYFNKGLRKKFFEGLFKNRLFDDKIQPSHQKETNIFVASYAVSSFLKSATLEDYRSTMLFKDAIDFRNNYAGQISDMKLLVKKEKRNEPTKENLEWPLWNLGAK